MITGVLEECWFNIYPRGLRGFFHETREGAVMAGGHYEKPHTKIEPLYRIHAKLRPVAVRISQSTRHE